MEKPKMPLSKIINETRQVGICNLCNSSFIRKYWISFYGKKNCINPDCESNNSKSMVIKQEEVL